MSWRSALADDGLEAGVVDPPLGEHGVQARVLRVVVDDGVHHLAEDLAHVRVGRAQERDDLAADALRAALAELAQGGVLVREVLVEAARRDARRLGDGAGRGGGVAARRELALRGVHQGGAGADGPTLRRDPDARGHAHGGSLVGAQRSINDGR